MRIYIYIYMYVHSVLKILLREMKQIETLNQM